MNLRPLTPGRTGLRFHQVDVTQAGIKRIPLRMPDSRIDRFLYTSVYWRISLPASTVHRCNLDPNSLGQFSSVAVMKACPPAR